MVEKTENKSAFIVVDSERCKGCGYCVAFCPVKIISVSLYVNQMGANPVAVRDDQVDMCTGCGTCALICPEAAISVFQKNK